MLGAWAPPATAPSFRAQAAGARAVLAGVQNTG